jgi:hypothetical protein
LITSERAWLAVCWVGVLLSVNVTVRGNVPLAVGVPAIAPVEEFRVNPAGRAPVMIDQVYGVAPLCPVRLNEYGDPAVPVGSAVVVMVRPATMDMLSDCVDAVCTGELLSMTFIVKEYGPAAVGVPVMAALGELPVPPTRFRPVGKLPVASDQEYGGVPF